MANRYACHDHAPTVRDDARTTRITAQDGWTQDGRRVDCEIITPWLPIECGHDRSADDPRCAGCRWQREKEHT